MPYIIREDGEHFVIPSYRDVLSAKQKSALKKEILLLSSSYGEYITMQRKGVAQYEVAFSPDTGYLLGESIWHHFNRPLDMIYCEAIPNTTEAILVIVKAGSVYLDGSFPLESIPEELVIFLTQQNNFEIYTYGDVPISETPEEGKFSFEATSVKSYRVLDKPAFPNIPLLKIYQLQLVEQVLKAQGIGVFPLRPIITTLIILGLIAAAISFLTRPKQEVQQVSQINPYFSYNDALTSPSPSDILLKIADSLKIFLTLPGWTPKDIQYTKGMLTTSVQSRGSSAQNLLEWAKANHYSIVMKTNGIYLTSPIVLPKRHVPTKIYSLNDIIATLVDRLSMVYPGNHLVLGTFLKKGTYTQVAVTINVSNISPMVFELIAKQLKDLPFVMESVKMSVANGTLTGNIIVDALGN